MVFRAACNLLTVQLFHYKVAHTRRGCGVYLRSVVVYDGSLTARIRKADVDKRTGIWSVDFEIMDPRSRLIIRPQCSQNPVVKFHNA